MSQSLDPESDVAGEPAGDVPADETPALNRYEIHAERTVMTEPGNTDGWIASDLTVAPPE